MYITRNKNNLTTTTNIVIKKQNNNNPSILVALTKSTCNHASKYTYIKNHNNK